MGSRFRQAILATTVVAASVELGLGRADEAPASAQLCGEVRTTRGKPIVGASVSIDGVATARTDSDGRWSIPAAAPGEALVTIACVGARVQALARVAAGETWRWNATIGTPGVLRGRVVDEYGHPLTRNPATANGRGWVVSAEPEQPWMNRPDAECWGAMTDENGEFRLRVSPDALFRLQVRATDSLAPSLWTEPISGGLADITLRVPPEGMPRSRVRCRVEDVDRSEPSPGAALEVRLHTTDGRAAGSLSFDAATGRWVSDRLPEGRYCVVAGTAARHQAFPSFEIRDAADVDLGTLRLPRPGRVRFVPDRSGPSSDGPVLLSLFGVRSFVSDAGELHTSLRHLWSARGPDLSGDAPVEVAMSPGLCYVSNIPTQPGVVERVHVPFEVRVGETTLVRVPLRGAPVRAVRLAFPGRAPSQALALFVDPHDRWVGGRWVIRPDQQISIRLGEGRHAISVLTSDRRRLSGSVDVPADDAPDRLDVVLR